MTLHETPVRTARVVGPQTSAMMTLSAFAAIDAAEVDAQTTPELLGQAMLYDLGQALRQSETNWSPVWVGISAQNGANMVYIARNNNAGLNQYTVVIRGTDFAIAVDKDEDNDVQTTQDFTVGKNPPVQIASGTATGHELVIGALGGDGNTLLQELTSLVGAGGEGSTIFVTGHSLGGALSTTVALYLQNALQKATFQVYTFAAPSAGLADFAALFDRTFPAGDPTANSSWRIYNAWDVVPQAWERDTLQAIRDWYPYPGPSQTPLDKLFVGSMISRPGKLQYQQPSVNPRVLNDPQDWVQAVKDPQANLMREVGFQHDSNTYLHLLNAPTVAMVGSIQPNKMLPGTSLTVDLTGLGFTADTKVSFSGDDVVVKAVRFESQAKLKVDVSVEKDAALGPRDAVVSSPTGSRISGGTSAFHVTSQL